MLRFCKRKNVIDQRLDELRREMSALDKEIRTADRAGMRALHVDRLAVAPQADAAPHEGDLFENAHVSAPKSRRAPDAPSFTPMPARRERFANYFMAGHFHNLRPSHQETRVLRAKAVLMLVLVLLAAFWLFYFFRNY